MLGGISIVESGPCFEEKKPLAQNVVCKFDGVVTAAEQLDATRTRCVLPMLLTSGRIPVALSVDGGLNFKYAGVFTLGKNTIICAKRKMPLTNTPFIISH